MERHVELLSQLVAIDSVNPDLVPSGAGEGAIGSFVAGWLREAGLEVEIVEPVPGRPSVVGVLRGSGGGRSLMLNAHMDTVGAGGMASAFSPVMRDGRVYGRGAYDMKASLAAIMVTAREAAALRLKGDLIITAVADEEVASFGTFAVVGAVIGLATGSWWFLAIAVAVHVLVTLVVLGAVGSLLAHDRDKPAPTDVARREEAAELTDTELEQTGTRT